MYYSTSSTLRKMGRAALHGHWPTAVMVTLGAGIVNVVLSLFQLRINTSAMTGVSLLAMAFNAQRYSIQSQIPAFLVQFMGTVITSILTVGMYNYFLQLHRGREAGFSLLLSRVPIWWKCVGQSLWISLLILLCALVTFVPGLLLLGSLRISSPVIALLLIFLLLLPTLVLSYRYAMAPFLLADNPEMGVMDSVRNSKTIMYNNKGRLFILQLSFIGWILLSMGISYVLSLLLPVLGTVFGGAISLVVQTYMNSAATAFYIELIQDQHQPETEKPEQAE